MSYFKWLQKGIFHIITAVVNPIRDLAHMRFPFNTYVGRFFLTKTPRLISIKVCEKAVLKV